MLKLKNNLILISLAACLSTASAEDWPMFRHDAGRSGATGESLPAELHPLWVRELPKLEPAWPDEPRMTFDAVYEPIVIGQTMIVGSSWNDSLMALDLETGEEKWRFYAEGPIRFSAVAWENKIYFISDDGYLYCLNAGDGSLHWKFRKGPAEEKVLGNGRMISNWPARGGPVIKDGVLYFGAGIWPFEGVFIHALDAGTGRVIWTQDSILKVDSDAGHGGGFSGVSPQGYMALNDDILFVPRGRAPAALLERETGKAIYYERLGKCGGFSQVCVAGNTYFGGGGIHAIDPSRKSSFFGVWGRNEEEITSGRGNPTAPLQPYPVISGRTFYSVKDYILTASSLDQPVVAKGTGRWADDFLRTFAEQWSLNLEKERAHSVGLKAGARLYLSAAGKIIVVDLAAGEKPAVSQVLSTTGTAKSLLAANGKLVVTTDGGRIYCFGATPAETKVISHKKASIGKKDAWDEEATSILTRSGVREGYCLALGVGSGGLLKALATQSELTIIALDPDPGKVDSARRHLDSLGLYGSRVSILAGDIHSVSLPPYFASLIVSEEAIAGDEGQLRAFIQKVYHPLRPYGGAAFLRVTAEQRQLFKKLVETSSLANATVTTAGEFTVLSKPGALPGAGSWTNHYGDSGNTLMSSDNIARAPLGILWFGNSPRERKRLVAISGPSTLVIGGRQFVAGLDYVLAKDVYTGRFLWERELPKVRNRQAIKLTTRL